MFDEKDLNGTFSDSQAPNEHADASDSQHTDTQFDASAAGIPYGAQQAAENSRQTQGYGQYDNSRNAQDFTQSAQNYSRQAQDGYQYQNCYGDRYQGQSRNGYAASGSGDGPDQRNRSSWDGSPNGGNQKAHTFGKKKMSAGAKVGVAAALLIVFCGVCMTLSFLAVDAVRDSMKTEEATAVPETVTEEKTTEDNRIAEQGEIKQTDVKTVTAVVTDVTDVVEEVMPSAVSITNQMISVANFWGQDIEQEKQASGSGIIIGQNDTELLIATNYHVVQDATTLHVQFVDGESVEANVKGSSSSMDLAVIAVNKDELKDSTKQSICIAKMGDSDNLKIGEPAIAIGNALGYGQSVTTGVISALNRTIEVSETGTSNALIQTDAAINPGNSGGALLNINGEVIGINTNKIGGSVVEGMGYAIPISAAKPIIEELMLKETKKKVNDEERGFLGITCINVTKEVSEAYGLPVGIFIAQVYPGTGAEAAGLTKGDIITKVDGTTVSNQQELINCMQYYKAGDSVTITIMKGTLNGYEEREVELKLCAKEDMDDAKLNP